MNWLRRTYIHPLAQTPNARIYVHFRRLAFAFSFAENEHKYIDGRIFFVFTF